MRYIGGLNNDGTIVGTYQDQFGYNHGEIDSNGKLSLLDYPGASGTKLLGIANNGAIIGEYGYTIVPERGTSATLALAGMLLIGWQAASTRKLFANQRQ